MKKTALRLLYVFLLCLSFLAVQTPGYCGEPVLATVGGPKHDIFQAPAWDYENGKRIAAGSSSSSTALSEGLWLLAAEGDDIYFTIGSGTQTANGSAAGSIHLAAGQRWGETVVGSDQEIGVIRKTTDAILWAVPAKTE